MTRTELPQTTLTIFVVEFLLGGYKTLLAVGLAETN